MSDLDFVLPAAVEGAAGAVVRGSVTIDGSTLRISAEPGDLIMSGGVVDGVRQVKREHTAGGTVVTIGVKNGRLAVIKDSDPALGHVPTETFQAAITEDPHKVLTVGKPTPIHPRTKQALAGRSKVAKAARSPKAAQANRVKQAQRAARGTSKGAKRAAKSAR